MRMLYQYNINNLQPEAGNIHTIELKYASPTNTKTNSSNISSTSGISGTSSISSTNVDKSFASEGFGIGKSRPPKQYIFNQKM
jgi:hypothetical protein